MSNDNLTPIEARISELLRIQTVLDAGDDLRPYLEQRLEQLYPAEYKEYRQRWQSLPDDHRHGRFLDFVSWRVLIIELADQLRLAEMLGEQISARVRRLQEILLADDI